jgi:lysophospholipase L1-like esterase
MQLRLMICAIAFLLVLGIRVAAWAADTSRPVDVASYQHLPIKLACVGDSITEGVGATTGNSYPSQLERMLGNQWRVGNFGSSGRTLLNAGDFPYQTRGLLKQAIRFAPDVVVIMLGTNDTKPQNWTNKDQFKADLKDLAGKFQKLKSNPRVFINTPPFVPGAGNYGINEAAVKEQLPMIEEVAKEMGITVIDVHGATDGKDTMFPDRVHPNNQGAELIARTVYTALTGKTMTESVIVSSDAK